MNPPVPLQPGAASRIRPGPFERCLAGFVAAVGCVVFAIAASIDPYDESGKPRVQGTHRQLGLPSCSMLSTIGFPCPSCGMTTSVSLLVHGDPAASWHANCAGTLIAGAGLVATVWLGLIALGVPRRPEWSAETVILALTVSGAGAAIVRYIGVIGLTIAGRCA